VEARIDVKPSYGLTDEQIEEMLESSIDAAETDVDERLLVEAKVEAEQILRAVEKALGSDADIVQEDELGRIQAVVSELKAAIDAQERKKISDLSKKLDEVTAPFAQRRIERDLQLALRGQSALEVADRLDRSNV
jgi:molecular chaperone HscA